MNFASRPLGRSKRKRGLVEWQAWINKTASSIRFGLDRANVTLKNWRGVKKVRHLGPARNNCNLQFVAVATNRKRAGAHRGGVSLGEASRVSRTRRRAKKGRPKNERLKALEAARGEACAVVAARSSSQDTVNT